MSGLALASGLLTAPTAGAAVPSWHEWREATASGRVTDSHGAGVADAEVAFYSPADPVERVDVTYTDWDGTWSIEVDAEWGLPPGTYLIRFAADEHRTIWYRQALVPERATPVALPADSAVTGLDARLPDPAPPGTISGRVRGNGAYLAAIPVRAYPAGSPDGWATAETVTDSEGRFRFDLAPGRYQVQADGSGFGLLQLWYSGVESAADARVIAVAPGAAVTAVNFDISFQVRFPKRPDGKLRKPRASGSLRGVPVDAAEGYQGQTTCRHRPRKGTKALRDLLWATYGDAEAIGLNRACAGDTSEHYDGRALDWMVDSRDANQARRGDSFTWWLTKFKGKEAGAMARRLGVMYVIWRGRIWKQYDMAAGWQTYSNCDQPKYRKPAWDNSCHRNHVHVSLTHRGARMKTSWWTLGG